MVNAYEFNSNQPRFYSKYFRDTNKGTHDVLIREAIGGSAAAPMFFDPQSLTNLYGIHELVIDGGAICQNPAMFAYLTAKHLKGHKNVRVISLGTGRDNEGIEKEQRDTKNFNKFDQFVSFGFMKFLADFDMTMVRNLFEILP